MFKQIKIAIAKYLASVLAEDPEIRLVLIEETTRAILTPMANPIVLTDPEKALIDNIANELL